MMQAMLDKFTRNQDAFVEHLPDLMKRFEGKHVVYHDEAMDEELGAFDTYESATKASEAKHGVYGGIPFFVCEPSAVRFEWHRR